MAAMIERRAMVELGERALKMGTVALIAAMVALARLAYGKRKMTFRKCVGEMGVCAAAALIVYGVTVHVFGEPSGAMAAVLASWCGLFADKKLRQLERAGGKFVALDQDEN